MFNGMEVLDVFMPEEIERLARQKPKFVPGNADIGRLMDFLPALRVSRLSHKDNEDLVVLDMWKEDFKNRQIPYVVLRKCPQIVKLYRERKADAAQQGSSYIAHIRGTL